MPYKKVLGVVPTLYSLKVVSKSYVQSKKKKSLVKQGVGTIVGVSLAKEINDFVEAI